LLGIALAQPVGLLPQWAYTRDGAPSGSVGKALRQYYAIRAGTLTRPGDINPKNGLLTQPPAETLRALLLAVTAVSINTEQYTYHYDESKGLCTLTIN
jgi:hypothetical protein